jgi:hypothetical protein
VNHSMIIKIFENSLLVHRSNVQLILTDLACTTHNTTLKQVIMSIDHMKKLDTLLVVKSKNIKLSSLIEKLLKGAAW